MKKVLKVIKDILLWGLAAFFALMATLYLKTMLVCIPMTLAAALIVPIESWQTFLKKFIKGKWIIVVVLFIAGFMSVPTTETEPDNTLSATATDVIDQATMQIEVNKTIEPIQTVMIEPTVTSVATVEPTATPTVKPTEKPVTYTYILNTKSKKFHYPSCGSAESMKASNRAEYTGTREALIARNYTPCGNCKP